jgi:hypothetical protein
MEAGTDGRYGAGCLEDAGEAPACGARVAVLGGDAEGSST